LVKKTPLLRLIERIVSNIADLIELHGSDVDIYLRAESGTDEYNRPRYTWPEGPTATERAWIQPVGYTTGTGERATEAGEIDIGDHVGYFKADSVVQKDAQVVWQGMRFDVKSTRIHETSGTVRYVDAILELMIE